MLNDLRFAVRQLAKSPGFTVVAVLTLAAAIGLTTGVFSVVERVLLAPLPFREPERLFVVQEVHRQSGYGGSSYDNFRDWTRDCPAFEETALILVGTHVLAAPGAPPADGDEVAGTQVTAGFFPMLGVRPHLGRWLSTEDETRGRHNVAILSYTAWQTRLGGRSDVVGQTIVLDERPHTVVGVMPPGFRLNYGQVVELWTPFVPGPPDRRKRGPATFARLRPGIDARAAQQQLDVVAARLEREFPASNTNWGLKLSRLQHLSDLAEATTTRALVLLLSAALSILLIACANVACLMLARSAVRAREMAVRVALGASRARVVRLAFTESLVLSLAGTGLGLLVARASIFAIVRLLPGYLGFETGLSLDLALFGFATALALASALLSGLLPALWIGGVRPGQLLRLETHATSASRRRSRLMSALIVGETALALALLICAGLPLRGLQRLLTTPLGFGTAHTLTMRLALPGASDQEAPSQAMLYGEIAGRLRGLPGVAAVALGESPPMSDPYAGVSALREGRPEPADWRSVRALRHAITPDYFDTLGIALLRGRQFSPTDTSDSEPVVIISERLRRREWPEEDPISRGLLVAGQRRTVIGVVADVRHRGPAVDRSDHDLYLPHTQAPSRSVFLIVRTFGPAGPLVPAVRERVRGLDRGIRLSQVRTMETALAEATADQRTLTLWLLVFAGLALALAVLGQLGIAGYSVAQRTQEIGVRAALGASRGSLLRLVLGRALTLAAIAAVAGMALAWAMARALSSFLYGVRPHDPTTYGAAVLIMVASTLVAAWLPARRAAKVEPIVALRHE
jgi:putative ABC transport system permease protein